jgi:hypothetical protein
VLRLDAASMLALVFLTYDHDPGRADWAIGRIHELVSLS